MKNILAIGAHPDDIEFGVGGTLVKHKFKGDKIVYLCMTGTESKDGTTGEILRTEEQLQSEIRCAAEILGQNLGHVVSYGEASGKPYDNLWSQLVLRSLTFSRLHIGHIDHRSDEWLQSQITIQEMIKNKKLKLFIEHIFAIEDFDLAYQSLDSRKISGKILIKIK